MDSQVIDLRGPHVSRVNDVLLDHDAAGFWQVSGVQTDLRALARRILSPAVVAAPAQTRLLRWADLELLAGELPALAWPCPITTTWPPCIPEISPAWPTPCPPGSAPRSSPRWMISWPPIRWRR